MTMAETHEMEGIAEAASERQDFQAAKRIARFVGLDLARASRRGRMADDLPDDVDGPELRDMLQMLLKEMPRGAVDSLRGLVGEIGRKAALEETINDFRSSPLGPILPEPLIRKFCEDMVAKAMGGPAPGKGRF
jgi:hypothetical protein